MVFDLFFYCVTVKTIYRDLKTYQGDVDENVTSK